MSLRGDFVSSLYLVPYGFARRKNTYCRDGSSANDMLVEEIRDK